MTDIFAKLGTDFFSTIVFLALYLISGDVVLATSVAIAGAVARSPTAGSRASRSPS
jgi:intracellular septation protein